MRTSPNGLTCGRKRRTSFSRIGVSLSENNRSIRPSTFISRLDSFLASIHSPRPDSPNRFVAAANTFGSSSHVITLPTPFAFNPSAMRSVLNPENVPVSTTNSGLIVVTRHFRKSSTSTSAVSESYMCHRSGCGHSGVARWYSGCSTSPRSAMCDTIRCSFLSAWNFRFNTPKQHRAEQDGRHTRRLRVAHSQKRPRIDSDHFHQKSRHSRQDQVIAENLPLRLRPAQRLRPHVPQEPRNHHPRHKFINRRRMHPLRRRHHPVRKTHSPRQRCRNPIIPVPRQQASNSPDRIPCRRRWRARIQKLQQRNLVPPPQNQQRRESPQESPKPRKSIPAEKLRPGTGKNLRRRFQHVIQPRPRNPRQSRNPDNQKSVRLDPAPLKIRLQNVRRRQQRRRHHQSKRGNRHRPYLYKRKHSRQIARAIVYSTLSTGENLRHGRRKSRYEHNAPCESPIDLAAFLNFLRCFRLSSIRSFSNPSFGPSMLRRSKTRRLIIPSSIPSTLNSLTG